MNTPDITEDYGEHTEPSLTNDASQESQSNDTNLLKALAEHDCIDEYETWLAELREARTGWYGREQDLEIERWYHAHR